MEFIDLLRAGEAICLIGCRVAKDKMSLTCRAAWLNAGESQVITLRKVDKTPYLKLLIPEDIQGQAGVLLGDGAGELIEFETHPLGM
jgi:hypothetical protein